MSRPSIRNRGCPLCGDAVSAEHAPFCSRGCRDRDLLAWLGEGYALPGRTVDLDDEASLAGLDNEGRAPL